MMKRKLMKTGTIMAMGLVSLLYVPWTQAQDDDLRRTPVVRAVQKVKKAVVNVSTYEQVYERTNPFSRFGGDSFFDRFFRDFYDYGLQKKSIRTSLGSGVIIDGKGHVLTNWHVVERASSITVTTEEEREYQTELVGADPKSDLAVLKIQSDEGFSHVSLGNSDHLLIGETVIAIGNPFGLSHTVTTGVVSAVHRSMKANEQVYENFIQTDASINPGNSGGPLLNINGELIGINTAIYGEAQGIGFAIPINTAKRIVADLLEYGEVRPPWLGLSVRDIDKEIAEKLGYSGQYGVIIKEVYQSSPAEKSRLKPGDIILSIDDQKIKSKAIYKRVMGLYTADDPISLTIFRNGKENQVTVIAGAYPKEYLDHLLWDVIGIRIIPNSRDLASRYGLYTASGVIITKTNPYGQAHEKGLKPGDVILKMQIKDIQDEDQLKKELMNNIHRESIVFLVQRGRYGYYVNFEL